MGLFDFLRRRPLAAAQAVVEARPAPALIAPTETVGVSGTTNFGGRLQTEKNPLLRDQLAYGRAGTTDWGEWEDIRRTNPWVAAAVEFVTAPIEDASVDVAVAGKHPDAKLAEQQAAFVRWNLTEALEPEFHASRSAAADGMLTSGFSLFEYFFQQRYIEEFGREMWMVPSLEERLPSSLSSTPWKEDERGNLVAVQQQAPKPGQGAWFTGEIPASQLLRFAWNSRGRNYAGFSAFRPVWYIAARIQPELLKLVGVTYQREGAGVPVATAKDPQTPLTKGQREELQVLLANLVYHENANAVMPAGWDINWVFSPAANKGHVLEAWRTLGVVVLQQLGAQQLALGTSDTGSRSVGEVHDARAATYVKKVTRTLASGYSQLAKRLVELNWGPQPCYPTVKLTLTRAEMGGKELVDAMAAAKNGGLITVTCDDENTVREKLGLSPISEEGRGEAEGVEGVEGGEEGEEGVVPVGVDGAEKAQDTALNGAQVQAAQSIVEAVAAGRLPRETGVAMLVTFFNIPQAVAERLMGPVGAGFEPKESAPPKRPEEGDEKPPGLKASADGSFASWRPLRASEKRTDWASIDAYLAGRREAFERAVKPVVVTMLARAQTAITEAMKDGDPSEVATLPLDDSELNAVVAQYLADVRKAGGAFARAELRKDSGSKLAEERRDVLSAAAEEEQDDRQPVDDAEAIDDTDALVDATQKAVVRRMTSRLRSELESEALDVVRTGGNVGDVLARVVTRQLESGAFRSDAGAVVARIFNGGRDEAARLVGGVAEVERSAVLDSKVCPACRAADGRRAAFGSAEHDALVPPDRDCDGGSNCRCLLLYLPDGGDE